MSYLRYSIRPTFPTDTLKEETPPNLADPESSVRYWRTHIQSDPTIDTYKENVLVIAIDARVNVVGHHLVSVGSNDECLLAIPEVLRPVILAGTNRFILVHNHPSGNPRPSSADLAITKRLNEACDIMKMHLVDHIIIGKQPTPFYSMREYGQLH